MAKIVGGETVTTRSWGWLVSLTHYSDQKHFCAGSILSSSWILTAAHCVFDRDASDIIINAGSNKLGQNTQQRRVATIIAHPFYKSDTFVNDIALIQLSSPLDMTDSAVAKICLPLKTGKTIYISV
jgi:secreted trypsin-like serine protease